MNPGVVIRLVCFGAILIAFGFGCSTANASRKGDVSRKEEVTGERGVFYKGIPNAYPGDVVIRLQSVHVQGGYEGGFKRVAASFVPIEYVYKGNNGFGGGPGSFSQPVEMERGKPFGVYLTIDGSGTGFYAQSLGNVLRSCEDETKQGQLKLDLVLAVPASDATKDATYETDFSHWLIESIGIHKP